MSRLRAFPPMMVLTLLTAGVQAADLPLLQLTMNDGVVSPQHLEVPAGKPFRLAIKNIGKAAAEFECKPLKQEQLLVPGVALVLDITGLRPGEYVFVDEFRENLPTGRGLIVVR